MVHTLKSPKTTKKGKIVGRGIRSGKGGHTSGRGTKGQKSRTGYKKPRPNFEGGQNPISRRVPKFKGFSRGYFASKVINRPVKLSKIAEAVKEGEVVNFDKLIDLKLIRLRTHKDLEVKIVFDKEIDKKLKVEGIATSETAKAAIEKAGGSVA